MDAPPVLERIHKAIDRRIGGRRYPRLEDLVDLVFSPCYGWSVVKLEWRAFCCSWFGRETRSCYT